VKGLGPFAAELVVLRGTNHPDGVPEHEARLDAEIIARYGPGTTRDQVAPAWRPYRTWAAVHLRALRERRTQDQPPHHHDPVRVARSAAGCEETDLADDQIIRDVAIDGSP